MTRSAEAWAKFLATRIVGLVADAAVLAVAYWGAVVLRFDFHAPRWGWRAVALSFVTVAVVQIVALVACGCYRTAWRRLSRRDLPRYFLAAVAACAVLTALRYLTPMDECLHVRPPYSVTLITSLLAALHHQHELRTGAHDLPHDLRAD